MARQFWEGRAERGGGKKSWEDNKVLKKGFNWNLLGDKPAGLKDKIKNIPLMRTWLWEDMLQEFIIFLSHLLSSTFSKEKGTLAC